MRLYHYLGDEANGVFPAYFTSRKAAIRSQRRDIADDLAPSAVWTIHDVADWATKRHEREDELLECIRSLAGSLVSVHLSDDTSHDSIAAALSIAARYVDLCADGQSIAKGEGGDR